MDDIQMPQLPDGIGMSIEEVQRLLSDKNKTVVSPDDPVLMMVTVLNAFLAEQNTLLERHKAAMVKIMADKTGEYVDEVKAATNSLASAMSDVTLAAMQKTFADHNIALINHKRDTMWLAAVVMISALVNVSVFVFR